MKAYIHFFVSLGSVLILLLFNSLNTQTTTITIPNPSFNTYNDLQVLFPNTLKCPCSTMTVPYHAFISLSPTLHQVCSSDFVGESWLSIMTSITNGWVPIDWRNQAVSQFKLLSSLCQLANKTINDAIRNFLVQSFATLSVPTEIDFNIQLNATLNQFFQSTNISFGLLVDSVRLLIQIDQPYAIPLINDLATVSTNQIVNSVTNETSGRQLFQVCLFSKCYIMIKSNILK